MKNRKGRVFTTLSWASIQMHMLIIQLSSNKPSLEMKNWRDQQTSSRGNQEERRTHNQNKNSVSNFHFGGGCRQGIGSPVPQWGSCCTLLLSPHTHTHTDLCTSTSPTQWSSDGSQFSWKKTPKKTNLAKEEKKYKRKSSTFARLVDWPSLPYEQMSTTVTQGRKRSSSWEQRQWEEQSRQESDWHLLLLLEQSP